MEKEDSKRYVGVRMRKWGKWVSEIRMPQSGNKIWLGSFPSAEQAARAYDVAAYFIRGPLYPSFNFPTLIPSSPPPPNCTTTHIRDAAASAAASFTPPPPPPPPPSQPHPTPVSSSPPPSTTSSSWVVAEDCESLFMNCDKLLPLDSLSSLDLEAPWIPDLPQDGGDDDFALPDMGSLWSL
ncbi:hypothetical protein SUGI_0835010 [Cryptomeria japonica]|uniref:ethylene-responsive transcription factor ERF016-like n=1 Tax=Cryptomeria japonica TaxID=3369 RepID=UPI00241485F0|nr:ethylene-responsive transcription factor ERF016-like [Cryptomeria japonica]GLJ40496.1 hypothetical protein SUGI_0835010 [Cryptomeria japonica]